MRRMYLQFNSELGKGPRLPSTLCHTESSIPHEPSGTDFGAKRALADVWIGGRDHGGDCAFADPACGLLRGAAGMRREVALAAHPAAAGAFPDRHRNFLVVVG